MIERGKQGISKIGSAFDRGYYLLVDRQIEGSVNKEWAGSLSYDQRREWFGPVIRSNGEFVHANKIPSPIPGYPAVHVRVPELERRFNEQLDQIDVIINGSRPWDPQAKDKEVFKRILRNGIFGLADSYTLGQWECEDLSGLVARVTGAEFEEQFSGNPISMAGFAIDSLVERARTIIDRDSPARRLASAHYDLGNDFFRSFLGETMVYSCAMWGDTGWGSAETLEEAQIRKLDILCRKLGLEPGMRVLDIGGGWGSFAIFAATEYGVDVVSTSISKEQTKFAEERRLQLPEDVARRIKFREENYRLTADGPYDRIVSVGMFEHVGEKNHSAYFKAIDRNLAPDGVAVVHTIVTNRKKQTTGDKWIVKRIFPNSEIPQADALIDPLGAFGRYRLRLKYRQDYGPNYDRTTMEWVRRLNENFGEFESKFESPEEAEQFRRTMEFYLYSSAGAFRSGKLGLMQGTYVRDTTDEDAYNIDEYFKHPEKPIKTSFQFPS